jgi:CBS domain-containing protein
MLPWRTREAAMTALRARDLLTTEVAKVPPETPVAAIARMFADRGISAVAVTDAAETLLGIVTESDLIRRLADEDERPSGWLARLFDSPGAQAERYARSHGVNAGEVMTRRVVTAGPEDSAAHVQNGVVEFYGFSRSEAVSRALCVLAENVPGVKGVVDHTSQRIGREPS